MFGLTYILLLLPVYTFAHCDEFEPIVTLRNPPNGRIKGDCRKSYNGRIYHSFTNIPYAEPPVGKKRLQKPEPVKPWQETYDATTVRKVCLQDPILHGAMIFGTEDCLVLNVYTPMVSKNSSKLLPVLFWIHGGAFQFGSGSHMLGLRFGHYDPAFFMGERIVVVTINYRLGALGYLTTHDDVIPANLGLRDQSLALRWVQANIDLFGGNPKDIVLAGESVGARSTCYHLLSNGPEMKGVTGGILISGSCLSPYGFGSNATARANAFSVGQKLGLALDGTTDNSSARLLQLLQSVPVDRFLHAAEMPFSPLKSDDGENTAKWSPVYAKDLYPTEPMTDAMDEGRFLKVPLLFGINSEECLSPIFLEFLPQIKRKAEVWDKDISKMVDMSVNVNNRLEAAKTMKAIYTNSSFSEDLAELVKFCTDDEFTLPVGRHAEIAAKYNIPVYLYQFDYRIMPHFVPGVEGVGHAEDMFFYWRSAITKVGEKFIPNFMLIVKRMVKLLSNFVKHKRPITKRDALFQNLKWPKFDRKNLQYMRINTDLQLLSDMRGYSTKRMVFDRYVQRPISVY